MQKTVRCEIEDASDEAGTSGAARKVYGARSRRELDDLSSSDAQSERGKAYFGAM